MTRIATYAADPDHDDDCDIEDRRLLGRLLLAANSISFTLAMALVMVAAFPSLRGDDPVAMILVGLAMLLARPLAAGR